MIFVKKSAETAFLEIIFDSVGPCFFRPTFSLRTLIDHFWRELDIFIENTHINWDDLFTKLIQVKKYWVFRKESVTSFYLFCFSTLHLFPKTCWNSSYYRVYHSSAQRITPRTQLLYNWSRLCNVILKLSK